MQDSDSDPASANGGDVFILDDLPPNCTVGCDTASLNSARPFPGFRDIPAGAHLIWVTPSESASARSGYWIYTPEKQPRHVYVKQWDKFTEVLGDPAGQPDDDDEREPSRSLLLAKTEQRSFGHLFPYNLGSTAGSSSSSSQQRQQQQQQQQRLSEEEDGDTSGLLGNQNIWYQLTLAISPKLLSRITGSQAKADPFAWHVTTTDGLAGESGLAAEEANLYASESSQQLRFTFPMGARLINPDATGAERTTQALDPTRWILDKLETRSGEYELTDLVGEFQFAFLVGMHLGNLSCLEQWFFLATRLVFRSFHLAVDRPQLARNLVQTFHAQLLYNERYLQENVLELMPDHARRLRLTLTTYKARLDEKISELGDRCTPDQQSVGIAFSSLESWLGRLGWDLKGDYVRSGNVMLEDGEMVEAEMSDFEDEDERGEFAPVIVEMDNGKETGLLSWDL
ncbi:A1 cistron-splicing factor [Xylaria sp. CBS 124048]|nr:A1 cistron-splicing factor [Xylaria sp. CBS 124048]